MKRLIPFLLLLPLIPTVSLAEDPGVAAVGSGALRTSGLPADGKPVTVPLDDTLNGLTVAVEINGKTVRLMLDTGACLTALSPAAAKELGLDPGRQISAKSSSGDLVEGRLAPTQRIAIGGAWTAREPVLVLDMPGGLAGLLGVATLADWDVRIDPAAKMLTLFPAGQEPAIAGESVLPLTCEVVDLADRGFRPMNLTVSVQAAGHEISTTPDTGMAGLVNLPVSFMEQHAPDALKEALPALRVGASVSGGVFARIVKLPELTFGPDTLKGINTHVGDIPQGSAQKARIGLGLLRHYVMTFRFAAGELHVKPLGTVQEVVATSGAGMFMEIAPDGRILISGLVPGGPAAKAGLLKGDEFLEIEGHPLKTMKPEQFAAFKRLPPGSAVKVRYRRGAEPPVEAVLVLVKK
jgi:predicted aspartyl protease